MKITDAFHYIAGVGSKLAKEDYLSQVDAQGQEVLKLVCDPIITFGVTVDEDLVVDDWKGLLHVDPKIHDMDMFSVTWWQDFITLMQKLSTRELSGNAANAAVKEQLECAPTEREAKWGARCINRHLRAGFSVATINKAFPGLIEPFAVQLAQPYDPDRHELDGDWVAEPKLDGLRMVVIDGVAYTRNGRTIETVGHILRELGSLTDEFVFDGEVMGTTEFNEDSGAIRRKSTGENQTLTYNVFDVVRRNHWFRRETSVLEQRKSSLDLVFDRNPQWKSIRKVSSIPLREKSGIELTAARDEFVRQGYEGVMLKDLSAPYCFKRSNTVLKFKDFFDIDGKIVDFKEGKGKDKGRLGAMFVEFDGVVTKVGSGFSQAQRIDLWTRKTEITGKMVEALYQGKTPDGKLRFPRFSRFRPDKD